MAPTTPPLDQLYVLTGDGDNAWYTINQELVLELETLTDQARFLADAIRQWHLTRRLFCGDTTARWQTEEEVSDGEQPRRVPLDEGEWSFHYKTPSDCGGCVSAQRLLRKIFGSTECFNQLPFVNYHGDRQYSFAFDLLLHYAEHGDESTRTLIEDRKVAAAKAKARAEERERRASRKRIKDSIRASLPDVTLSTRALSWLVRLKEQTSVESLRALGSDVVVCRTSRSEYGGYSGVGYFDQVRVYYHGQSAMQEWQWRDRYSHTRDQPHLAIHDLGDVSVQADEKIATVKIELINRAYPKRTATFTFKPAKQVMKPRRLSSSKAQAFAMLADAEMERVLAGMKRLWEHKPTMLADYSGWSVVPAGSPSYVPYRQPSIKERMVLPEEGRAVFVTEEQIDHRTRYPQMRYELFVLTAGDSRARSLFEDHAYEGLERSAVVAIVDVSPDTVVINTHTGQKTISIR